MTKKKNHEEENNPENSGNNQDIENKDPELLLEKAKKELCDSKKEIDALKDELASQKDLYIRLLAEYDNYRKRTSAEKTQIYTDAASDTIEKFLPVLDNLERACSFASNDSSNCSSIKEGLDMITKSFKETFEKCGVKEIPALGEKFDPNLHNAVMHDEDSSVGENTVTEVFQKGYTLNEKVIRHCMVKVTN